MPPAVRTSPRPKQRPLASSGLCCRSTSQSSVPNGRWNHSVCAVTADVNAVPASC